MSIQHNITISENILVYIKNKTTDCICNCSDISNLISYQTPISNEAFDYSSKERVIMSLINSMSNIFALPCILYLIKRKNNFGVFISTFTFISSFMYHLCDGLSIKSLVLSESDWHVMDNIGSIGSFNFMIMLVTRTTKDRKEKLNFLSLLIAYILQMSDPWNLTFTLLPICIYLILSIYINYIQYIKHDDKEKGERLWKGLIINKDLFLKAGLSFLLALVFFVIGLNEHYDYLRIAHSFWHVIGSYSFYHILHFEDEDKGRFDEEKENEKVHYEEYWSIFKRKEILFEYVFDCSSV